MEEKNKLEPYSCKLTQENKEAIAELKESGGFNSVNHLFDTLFERYNNPIKANKENEALIKTLTKEKEDLLSEISSLKEELLSVKESNSNDCAASQEENRVLKSEIENLKEEIENLKEANHLPDNAIVVNLEPKARQILSYVAFRESQSKTDKNQNWSIEDLINTYAIKWLGEGKVFYHFNCISDRILNAIKKELEDK